MVVFFLTDVMNTGIGDQTTLRRTTSLVNDLSDDLEN